MALWGWGMRAGIGQHPAVLRAQIAAQETLLMVLGEGGVPRVPGENKCLPVLSLAPHSLSFISE